MVSFGSTTNPDGGILTPEHVPGQSDNVGVHDGQKTVDVVALSIQEVVSSLNGGFGLIERCVY